MMCASGCQPWQLRKKTKNKRPCGLELRVQQQSRRWYEGTRQWGQPVVVVVVVVVVEGVVVEVVAVVERQLI